MRVVDLNGKDHWSLKGIRQRYADYARQCHVDTLAELQPTQHSDGETTWIYPVLEQVFAALALGDAACVELAIDLVCDDARFTFGKNYKDRAATLLRRVALSPAQQDRLRRRIVSVLYAGTIPPEYRCYAKLLRSIGLGPYRACLDSVVPRGPRVRRYLAYFRSFAG